MRLAMLDVINIDRGALGGKVEKKTAIYVRPFLVRVPKSSLIETN